jgi:hypothetical protein
MKVCLLILGPFFIGEQIMQARLIGEQLIGVGQFTTAIASGASTTTIKSGIGRLCRISITAGGTASFTIFDNTAASGVVLYTSAATTTTGTVIDIQLPAQVGITVVNQVSGAAFTVSYS